MNTLIKPKTSSRKYTRRSEAQWRKLIEDFEHSDMTLEAYCQHHKIAASSFYTWRLRFEDESGQDTSTASLINVTDHLRTNVPTTQAENTSWQVELELGNGRVLRIKTA